MHTDEEKLMENQLSNPTPLYLRVAAGPPIMRAGLLGGPAVPWSYYLGFASPGAPYQTGSL